MGFSGQEYWSGLTFLLQAWNPHISCFLPWQADSLLLAPQRAEVNKCPWRTEGNWNE